MVKPADHSSIPKLTQPKVMTKEIRCYTLIAKALQMVIDGEWPYE